MGKKCSLGYYIMGIAKWIQDTVQFYKNTFIFSYGFLIIK